MLFQNLFDVYEDIVGVQ